MGDIVFCTECRWFKRNNKSISESVNTSAEGLILKSNNMVDDSYYDCSHQFNLGKRFHWWGIERYYKRRPSSINAKNDCTRFDRGVAKDEKK